MKPLVTGLIFAFLSSFSFADASGTLVVRGYVLEKDTRKAEFHRQLIGWKHSFQKPGNLIAGRLPNKGFRLVEER